ncbi:beta-L-arabinofuranosidase domain-containing protein [Streptoalloteichus hindustanus]|uniref:Non-reducing end beta-L-arabinofuranosidase-like GH127 catalytic domain-containing protein n=2 Tax=Streptoalloteichus hindustanus TaxID=2017 RepID=A0A1M5JFU6_STRHI|nr:beta-L-arabinofuranosidase domain-containing protein [Streptoalloteichus hindustanus]SHG39159.1 hypothetical protein SAMN05444320_108259 [Streptoalloteichus hindustanus]
MSGNSPQELKSAAQRAANWLVERQRPNGALPSRTAVIESCYKGMWALHTAGHTQAASAVADYVTSLLQADGDIPQPREEEYFLDVHYLYANGYLTIGAHVLGRFGLSSKLMSFVETMQNPVTGGFRSHGPAVPGDGRCDSVSTSISGLAALYTGRLSVARSAADFLGSLWAGQPDRENLFHAVADAQGNVLTSDDAVTISVRKAEGDWYFIGLPALFLTALHEATEDQKYLDLATELMTYMDETCDDDAFIDSSCGKAGVAAAMLYRLTGKPRYREIAQQIGDLLCERQTPYGYWSEEETDDVADLFWGDLDMTAEYVMWLDLIARNLASGERVWAGAGAR